MNKYIINGKPNRRRNRNAKYTDADFMPGWDVDNNDFNAIMRKRNKEKKDLTHEEQERLGYYLGSICKGAYRCKKTPGHVMATNNDEEFRNSIYCWLLRFLDKYDPDKGTNAFSFFTGCVRWAVLKASAERKKSHWTKDVERNIDCLSLVCDLRGNLLPTDDVFWDKDKIDK